MVRTKRRSTALSYRIVFVVGAFLVLVGLVGLVVRFIQGQQFVLADIIDSEVMVYGDITLNKDAQSTLNQLSVEQESFISELSQSLSLSDTLLWEDWITKRAFIGLYENDEVVLAFPKKGKKNARSFIKTLSLEGEGMSSFVLGEYKFFSPSYSSFVVAGNIDGYIVVASSKSVLETHVFRENVLAEYGYYKALKKHIPRSSFAKVYFSSEKFVNVVEQQNPEYKPLFDVVSQTLPAGMMSMREEKGNMALHMNIHTVEGVFASNRKEKRPRQTLPALAQFAPKDVLFFMNGIDIAYKYEHTKTFLSQFHPQFALLFEGIMRAESSRLLGDDFDFEKDFLSHLSGQYATIVHGFPQPYMTLVSDVRVVDRDEVLSQFHKAVHQAQTQFSTKTQVVELPDGTTREELVALDPREVSIEKKEFEGIEYFVAQSVSAEQQFSYGIVENYFVFSSHEEGLQSVIASYKGLGEHLGENADFRESVLFGFSPSESYGFVHLAGWREMFQSLQGLLSETEGEVSDSSGMITSFLEGARTATFARKVYPNQVIVDMLLFAR